MISYGKDKASILNDQFQSFFTREGIETQRLPTISCHEWHPDNKGRCSNAVKNLNFHKAPGPDGITPRVMKELLEPAASILTTIFVTSYENGEIPDDWKNANITPLRKAANMILATTGPSPLRVYRLSYWNI